MLMGLVTKNAILLVDFTNTLRGAGDGDARGAVRGREDQAPPDRHDDGDDGLRHAPAGAGARRRRSEMRQGMAVVVVGGLTSSALLTLVLVPVVYTYMDGWRVKVPGLFRRVAWAAKLPWKGRPANPELEMGK